MSEDEIHERIIGAFKRMLAEAMADGDTARACDLREMLTDFSARSRRPRATTPATNVQRHPLAGTIH